MPELKTASFDPSATIAWNFKLLGHHELDGFGGMGEGMSIQVAKDGRRIIWLAHESAPKNFTAVDVTDPRNPQRRRADRVAGKLHALELAGGHRQYHGGRLSDPEGRAEAGRIRAVRHFGAGKAEDHRVRRPLRAAFARRAPVVVLRRRITSTWRPAPPISQPTHPLDDQCYQIFDVRNPSKPIEVGRWWLPGTREGDDEPPPARHPKPLCDMGFRAHNTNVYPQRPDRCYLGYIDGGMFIMDISDKSRPKPIRRWDNSPPYHGFTHTMLPLFDRGLARRHRRVRRWTIAADWPKLIWILDGRDETNPVPIATCPLPYRRVQGARWPLRRPQHPRERAVASCLVLRPGRDRHLLQWRHPRLRHLQSLSAQGDRDLRAGSAAARSASAPSSSTTCSWTSAGLSTRSIAKSAGCTFWKWSSSAQCGLRG